MNYKEIESFLTNLEPVISCKIIVNENDIIEEIHILSDKSRNTKQVSRDVQSLLAAKYNLTVDYKIISIAQIEKELSKDANFRLKHKSISYESFDGKIKIKIKLQCNEKEFEGETIGIKSESNNYRLAVEAALNSVESAIGSKDSFVLEDLKIIKLAEKDVIIVAVSIIINGEEQLLCGSAFIGTDRMESAVKAALNAINRKIARYNID